MKKNLLLFVLTVFIAIAQLSAQIKPLKNIGRPVIRCYTTESINIGRKQNPNAETDAHFEKWLKTKMLERQTENLVVKPYVVPIIFHVLYDGEAEGDGSNISQALIQQQILQLNKDYANQSNSPYKVAAATGIQFVLAQKDPNGNSLAEPGIERIDRNSRAWQAPGSKGWSRDYIADSIKPKTIWNPEKYINVWLVPAMNNGGTGKLLGFSTFPVASTLDGLDASPLESNNIAGVVIDHATVGSIFRPQTCDQGWGKGKTLSHELGHYFGLRHIWGDATCGNDYVDDTPTQEAANYGSPIHPKPDACGTPDEMFENYMDYTDDELLNTFTADQVDRMQTVLLYSPRRTNLPNSDVGFVTITGSNKIAFAGCTGEITTPETGTTGTYPRYRDISLLLNCEYKATDAATVTINTNGTAVNNTQYQLLTPTVTFAKGDAYKSVVVRLIDNAAVDGDRTLNISYTISGNGVVADTGSQNIAITVNDDDNIAFAGNSVVNIIDEHFETVPAGALVPAGWGSFIQSGYPNLFVVGPNGNAGGSGKAAYLTNNKTTLPNTYTKGIAGVAELLSPQINPLQYRSLDSLKFKYSVRGSANDHGYVLYDIGDGSLYFWGGQGLTGSGPYYGTNGTQSASLSLPVPSGVTGKKFNIAFYWETDTLKDGGDPGLNIDDVSLSGEPYSIETAVSSSYAYDVQPAFINKFRSTNNKIIADIDSVSATVTNVTAAITEAGNTQASMLIDSIGVSRTKKVITIKPATEDATTYTATFYFTADEMTPWGTIAGNLKILKVRNGVALSGNVSSKDVVVIYPTYVDNRLSTQGFITYTATITGFGQFMLTDSTLDSSAFTWISFTGALTGNNSILLDWKTANENKELPFEVQRSTDSVSFTKIGSVTANNAATNEYTYNDKGITKGTKYYYRIKQTDSNGNTSYSPIIGINYPADTTILAQWIKMYPNPMKDKLLLDFGNPSSQSVNIMITDMSGRVVYNTTSTVQGHKEILTAFLSRAIYIVKVQTTDRVVTFEIMKK